MSKKDVLIKPTRDGRYWAMGVVVETVDEALERCTIKAPGKNIHVEWPEEPIGKFLTISGVCGSPEYVKDFLCA